MKVFIKEVVKRQSMSLKEQGSVKCAVSCWDRISKSCLVGAGLPQIAFLLYPHACKAMSGKFKRE